MHNDAQMLIALTGPYLLEQEAWNRAFDDLPIKLDDQRQMLRIVLMSYAAGYPYTVEQFEAAAVKYLKGRSRNSIKHHRTQLQEKDYITIARAKYNDGRKRHLIPTEKALEQARKLGNELAWVIRVLQRKLEDMGSLPSSTAEEPTIQFDLFDEKKDALSLSPLPQRYPEYEEIV